MRFFRKTDGRQPLRETPIARQLRAQAASPIARQLRVQAVQRARRARWQALILLPVLGAVIWAYSHRRQLFGVDLPVRIASAIVLVVLGWAFARALGRALGPALFRRMDGGTAGTVGFLIRLAHNRVADAVRQEFGAQSRSRARPAPAGADPEAVEPPTLSPEPSPSQWAIAGDEWDRLLRSLPAGYRVIAERVYERNRATLREQFFRIMSGTDQVSEARTIAEVERLLRCRGVDLADLVE